MCIGAIIGSDNNVIVIKRKLLWGKDLRVIVIIVFLSVVSPLPFPSECICVLVCIIYIFFLTITVKHTQGNRQGR